LRDPYRTKTVSWSCQCAKSSPRGFCMQQRPSVEPTDCNGWAMGRTLSGSRNTRRPKGNHFGAAKGTVGHLSSKGAYRPQSALGSISHLIPFGKQHTCPHRALHIPMKSVARPRVNERYLGNPTKSHMGRTIFARCRCTHVNRSRPMGRIECGRFRLNSLNHSQFKSYLSVGRSSCSGNAGGAGRLCDCA
jgi:hypothetical protein